MVTFVIGLGTPTTGLISLPKVCRPYILNVGIAVDLTVYSIIIPVMPFQLERLGYTDVSSLTGWLLFSFVRLIYFAIVKYLDQSWSSPLA